MSLLDATPKAPEIVQTVDFCKIYKPVRWHEKDIYWKVEDPDSTLAQIKYNNAKWTAFCRAKPGT